MDGWYWIAVPDNERWFQIDEIFKIEDNLTEASACIKVNGEDRWGLISVDDVDRILQIKPEIVEKTLRWHARKAWLWRK